MTSKFEAHGGEHLSGKVILTPGAKPLIKGGGEHRGRASLFDGSGNRPSSLSGIGDAT